MRRRFDERDGKPASKILAIFDADEATAHDDGAPCRHILVCHVAQSLGVRHTPKREDARADA